MPAPPLEERVLRVLKKYKRMTTYDVMRKAWGKRRETYRALLKLEAKGLIARVGKDEWEYLEEPREPRHEEVVTNCPICGKELLTRSVIDHIVKVHADEVDELADELDVVDVDENDYTLFHCRICGAKFWAKEGERHLARHILERGKGVEKK